MAWPFKSALRRASDTYRLQVIEAKSRLLESTTNYWDKFVDPREAFVDQTGEEWMPIGATGREAMSSKSRLNSEQALGALRTRCRLLASENEWAINGHENRVSYVVGTGLQYTLEPNDADPVSDDLVAQAQAFLDAVLDANQWASREQEAVRRGDRDGEVFLRVFYRQGEDGEILPAFRFIEPEDVSTPREKAGDKSASWGIQTDPSDVETVLGYYVTGEDMVPAAEVLHCKLNVDRNQKRGVPTFYPVRKNLVRAEKLLRNMSAVATIQAAIALIREHEGFSSDQVETFRDDQDDFTVSEEATGKTRHFSQFGPGTIIDAPAGTKYQFPIAGVAAEKFVLVLQAELRAVAARLVMPEFMFTSDASNANYSSTMVAEGPAVKMFQRLQSFWREAFVAFLWSAVETAVRIGSLPEDALKLDLTASLPSLTVRDEEKEGKTLGREQEAGVLSKRTWSEIRGYDHDRERARIDEEREHAMESMPAFTLPVGDGEEEEDEGEDDEE